MADDMMQEYMVDLYDSETGELRTIYHYRASSFEEAVDLATKRASEIDAKVGMVELLG